MAVAQVTLLMPRRQKTEKTARHDKTKALTATTYERLCKQLVYPIMLRAKKKKLIFLPRKFGTSSMMMNKRKKTEKET